MAVLDAIKSLLQCVVADGSQHAHALLQETDPSAKLQRLTLSELTSGVLVIAPDKARVIKDSRSGREVAVCLSPLFCISSTHDHNRACDAVVIRLNDLGKLDLLYLDLKSDMPSGYEGQFKSTRCFLRYVCHVLAELYGEPAEIGRERFAIVHTDTSGARLGFRKTTTRFPGPIQGQTPDNPYKRIVQDSDTIRYTELLRGTEAV